MSLSPKSVFISPAHAGVGQAVQDVAERVTGVERTCRGKSLLLAGDVHAIDSAGLRDGTPYFDIASNRQGRRRSWFDLETGKPISRITGATEGRHIGQPGVILKVSDGWPSSSPPEVPSARKSSPTADAGSLTANGLLICSHSACCSTKGRIGTRALRLWKLFPP